jgi:hypothetical protein
MERFHEKSFDVACTRCRAPWTVDVLSCNAATIKAVQTILLMRGVEHLRRA